MKQFNDITMNSITGEPVKFSTYKREGLPGRQRRDQVRPHPAVRRSAYPSRREQSQGFYGPRFSL